MWVSVVMVMSSINPPLDGRRIPLFVWYGLELSNILRVLLHWDQTSPAVFQHFGTVLFLLHTTRTSDHSVRKSFGYFLYTSYRMPLGPGTEQGRAFLTTSFILSMWAPSFLAWWLARLLVRFFLLYVILNNLIKLVFRFNWLQFTWFTEMLISVYRLFYGLFVCRDSKFSKSIF
jgi:hypothetical protein